MLNKDQAKEEIAKLVEKFRKEYGKIKEYSEDDIRAIFIDPLFESLGWEKDDALRQKTVEKAGKPDYIFYLNNKQSFVVEAKRAGIILSEEHGRQSVSYAWHSNIKFAVLTNFEDTRVYFAGSNTKYIDKYLVFEPQTKEPLRINFKDYLERFDLLWLLSKESFKQNLLEKCISTEQIKLSKPIDDTILNDLIEFRQEIASSIKKLNPEIQNRKEQIYESTQHLLCRLIFIRSLEDRNLEKENLLFDMARGAFQGRTEKRLFPLLSDLFKEMNGKYDSSLFEPHLLDKLTIDEQVLIKVIKGLYFGVNSEHEKYEFNYIPVSLLGSIYEQYLGIILRETEKRIKLDNGKGKRKSMGIYYTPEYIVNYIVKNTVGEYTQNKSIDEILQVKIVDPACGSGSFLISAFSEICKFIEEKLRKGEKGTKIVFKNYNERLNLGQKVEILKSCIFGVDLDEQAVEMARLSLLLKLLEGETESIKKMLLPTMKDNIKCGNSLIDDSKLSDKAFNWKAQFSDVFKQGGFDIVIGNPPYGAELPEKDRLYLESKFRLGNTDTACLFMSFATKLVNKTGINSFIIPKPFVYSSTWAKIREHLLDGLLEIVDCGKVWKEVKLEQVIYLFESNKKINSYRSCIRKNQEIVFVGDINKETFKEFGFLLNGISEKELKIGRKIKNSGISLDEFVINQRGAIYQKEVIEKPSDFKVLGGAQIGRYIIYPKIKGYISRKIVSDDKAFIKEDSILVQRIVAHIENPIDHIKITALLSKGLKISDYIIVDTINQLQNKGKLSSEFLVAIINSKLTNWYAYRFIFGKAIRTMQFDNPVTERIIIPKIDLNDKKDQQIYDKIISLVSRMTELQKKYYSENISGNEKERMEQQIGNVDYEIDEEVYNLYGITEEEKKIIGESLK